MEQSPSQEAYCPSASEEIPSFMGPKDSLPCSQEPYKTSLAPKFIIIINQEAKKTMWLSCCSMLQIKWGGGDISFTQRVPE
jgi:hypothetical protein